MSDKHTDVYVGVCTDDKTGRSYVYGVFTNYDYANGHYKSRPVVEGESYRVTTETLVEVVKP